MKKIILAISTSFLVSNAYSQENLCEKLWQVEQAKTIQIQKLKSQTCAFIWDDAKVVQLLKKLHLNPDNPQWMATDDCDVIQVGQQKYTLYKGYYKNDLSDVKIIRDSSNNLYGFFRDLGKYSFVDDAFKPTATANKHGVDLKCAAIGNNPKLPNILIQYIFQKGIDLSQYSHHDNAK